MGVRGLGIAVGFGDSAVRDGSHYAVFASCSGIEDLHRAVVLKGRHVWSTKSSTKDYKSITLSYVLKRIRR